MDNMVVASTEREVSVSMMQRIVEECEKAGLLVHEITLGAQDLTTFGWEYRYSDQSFRPKKARLWRLHGAFDHALTRGSLSGR